MTARSEALNAMKASRKPPDSGGTPSKSGMPATKKKLGGSAPVLSRAAWDRQMAAYKAGKRKRPPQKPTGGGAMKRYKPGSAGNAGVE